MRLYNQLFSVPEPNASDFVADLNPASLEVLNEALVEPALKEARPGVPVQFERQGYFCADVSSTPDALVFNRTVSLRDSWAKVSGKAG